MVTSRTLVVLALAGLLVANMPYAQAGRTTSCTGPESDGANETCNLVLYGGEAYEIEAMFSAYAPYKGTADGQELCAGASPLGNTAVTGQCAIADLKTPNDIYGATLDATQKSTAQGTGLRFVMPAAVQAGGVQAYTVNLKDDGAGTPTHRFVTTMTTSSNPVPSAAYSPAFVGATTLLSAALVGLVSLF